MGAVDADHSRGVVVRAVTLFGTRARPVRSRRPAVFTQSHTLEPEGARLVAIGVAVAVGRGAARALSHLKTAASEPHSIQMHAIRPTRPPNRTQQLHQQSYHHHQHSHTHHHQHSHTHHHQHSHTHQHRHYTQHQQSGQQQNSRGRLEVSG